MTLKCEQCVTSLLLQSRRVFSLVAWAPPFPVFFCVCVCFFFPPIFHSRRGRTFKSAAQKRSLRPCKDYVAPQYRRCFFCCIFVLSSFFGRYTEGPAEVSSLKHFQNAAQVKWKLSYVALGFKILLNFSFARLENTAVKMLPFIQVCCLCMWGRKNASSPLCITFYCCVTGRLRPCCVSTKVQKTLSSEKKMQIW